MANLTTRTIPDHVVLEARKEARENPTIITRIWSEKFNVPHDSLEKALRGQTYKHLNPLEPPVSRRNKKEETEKQARVLYQAGMSYNQISEQLKVPKSSISRWCGDLAKVRYPEYMAQRSEAYHQRLASEERQREQRKLAALQTKADAKLRRQEQLQKNREDYRKLVRADPSKVKRGICPLNDEDVLALRRRIRADDYTSVKDLAKEYSTTINTVQAVVRGRSFKHLDTTEPPLTGRFKNPGRLVKTPRPTYDILQTLNGLRRKDPWKWSYKALNTHMFELCGSKMSAENFKQLMLQHDPSLVEVRRFKPTTAFPIYQKECVVCEVKFSTRHEDSEICFRKACREVIEEYSE